MLAEPFRDKIGQLNNFYLPISQMVYQKYLKNKKTQVIGLTGGQGSGKSTILDLILGLIDPIKGENVNDLANYWYLMDTPAGESLMDLMPSPPYHMLGVIPLAVVVFFITYLPFLFWDKFKKA